MKYFSLAILALVCASAVVSAAPSQQFDESLATPLEGIKEKLIEYFVKFQCARNVIEKALKDTDYQGDYEEFKRILDEIILEHKQCSSGVSKPEQLKCAVKAIASLPVNFYGFFEKFTQKNKEFAKEVRDQVTSECFATQGLFAANSGPSVEKFQCVADTLAEFSNANGLKELWSRTQPELQQHIDNYRACEQAGSETDVDLCNTEEIYKVFGILSDFQLLVSSQNPKVIPELENQLNQKCSGAKAGNMFFSEIEQLSISNHARKIVKKVKCVVVAVDEIVKGTDLESVFDELYDLIDSAERLKSCIEKSNKLEAAICVLSEAKGTNEKAIQLLHKLQEISNTAATALRGEVSKCLA